jgi:N-acetylglucosaminyl-diphospho-decaprenol L-rhamnosyltransferase
MKYGDSKLISVSIVSHGQLDVVADLLADIQEFCSDAPLEVILTLNIDEPMGIQTNHYSYPIVLIKNEKPKGFGANHNQAFRAANGEFFCVLNPDIRLTADPFQSLLEALKDELLGVCAPLVLNEEGQIEDSARRFPSPLVILKKVIGSKRSPDYQIGSQSLRPDWVGGMFMLFRSAVYEKLGGFDERYFLYYEDVDLCARLNILGMHVVLTPASSVIHLAQRTSHRNLKYMRWHLSSMLRFFLSHNYRRLSWRSF